MESLEGVVIKVLKEGLKYTVDWSRYIECFHVTGCKNSDYLNHIIMQATENWRQEGLGTYSSPNWKCVSETMVGYRVGQGFHLRLFQKQYRGGLLVAVHLFLQVIVARKRL